MDLIIFEPAGEAGALNRPMQQLLREMPEWSLQCFQNEIAALVAVQNSERAAVLVDAEETVRTPAFLRKLAGRHPETIRVACASAQEMRKLRDLCGWANQFVFKPLAPERLRQRLQLAESLRPLLTHRQTLNLVTGLKTLPAFLDAYAELLDAMDAPDVSLENLGLKIERDVGLCSTILSLANSAFFGRASEATTAAEAVGTLGLSAIRAVVMAYPALSLMDRSPELQKRRAEFWSHAQRVSEIARVIARRAGLSSQGISHAYSGGLLHDVGKLILGSNHGQKYDTYLDYAQSKGEPLHRVEQAMLGTNHALIGAFMLAIWGVPKPIVNSIWQHHAEEKDQTDVIDVPAVVRGANQVAHLLSAIQRSDSDEATFDETDMAPRIIDWANLVREEEATVRAQSVG
ncbi:MAG: HDOD domain-containing protein [Opitutales bacterium]